MGVCVPNSYHIAGSLEIYCKKSHLTATKNNYPYTVLPSSILTKALNNNNGS